MLFWFFNYWTTGMFSLSSLLFLAYIGYNTALWGKWNEIQLFGKIESGVYILPGSWTTVTLTLFFLKVSTKLSNYFNARAFISFYYWLFFPVWYILSATVYWFSENLYGRTIRTWEVKLDSIFIVPNMLLNKSIISKFI
jgi:hypothetical protein